MSHELPTRFTDGQDEDVQRDWDPTETANPWCREKHSRRLGQNSTGSLAPRPPEIKDQEWLAICLSRLRLRRRLQRPIRQPPANLVRGIGGQHDLIHVRLGRQMSAHDDPDRHPDADRTDAATSICRSPVAEPSRKHAVCGLTAAAHLPFKVVTRVSTFELGFGSRRVDVSPRVPSFEP
jgi:hypothetical protein